MAGNVASNNNSVQVDAQQGEMVAPLQGIWTVDFVVLSVLFLSTLLCIAPVSIGGISLPDILRIAALLYLYFKLFLRVMSGLNLAPVLPLFGYLFVSIVVFFVSVVNYGVHVSVVCYGQFILVTLMGPLFCYFITNRRQAHLLILMWVAVCFIGFLTLLLQKYHITAFDWFADYQANRGGLSRFKTILGNPNPTGVCGALLALLGLFYFKKLKVRLPVFFIGMGLLAFSLSRGALVTFTVGFICYFLLSATSRYARRRVLLAVVCCIVLAFLAPLIPGFNGVSRYFSAYENIVSSAGSAQGALSSRVQSPMNFVKNNVIYNPIALVVGSGYGVSGSASAKLVEKGNARATGLLPNSGLLELFLDGGAILLGSFLFLFGFTWLKLYRLAKVKQRGYYTVALALLAGIFIYSIVYPTFYQPNVGSLLWLLISLGLVDRYLRA